MRRVNGPEVLGLGNDSIDLLEFGLDTGQGRPTRPVFDWAEREVENTVGLDFSHFLVKHSLFNANLMDDGSAVIRPVQCPWTPIETMRLKKTSGPGSGAGPKWWRAASHRARPGRPSLGPEPPWASGVGPRP